MSGAAGFGPRNLAGLLETAARRFGERPFLHDSARGVEIGYRSAWLQVRAIADALRRSGVRRGNPVVVVSENRAEVPLVALAAAQVGAVFTVLGDGVHPETLREILRRLEPALVMLGGGAPDVGGGGPRVGLEDFVRGAAARGARPADPASGTDLDPVCVIFTSGSTGEPRGVVLSHDNLLFATQAIQRRLGYRTEDTVGLFLPFSFDYGLYQVFLAARVGARVSIGDARGVGPDFLVRLRRDGVTVLPCVPTLAAGLLRLLARRPASAPALRALTSTGEHLPEEHVQQLQRLLPDASVYAMYGLTECKRVSVRLPEEAAAHPGSVGRPLDGTEVVVMDRAGTRLPPGVIGELYVRGRHVALGYWGDPAATAATFPLDPQTGARSLRTGDFGSIDANGFLHVEGRRDGLLKHHGYRLSAREVEAAALRISGVSQAVLVRDPGADELHLFVSMTEPADPQRVVEGLRARLEAYKVPEHVHPLPEFPRNVNGKVDRTRLLAQVLPGTARP